ncbi:MAG: Gfo/Idh/MocA family oxidoreductase [Acidobacteriota bacterium]
MSSPVKVAVVGVGALGQHHARIYAAMPEADLVGVVDIREERAREVGNACRCQPFGHYLDLIDQVEAISLAVPTLQHATIGREFLERGVHVLVEKPIAADLPSADALIEAREKGGTVLLVGHSERFNPAVSAVRPLITRPRFFEAHRMGVFVRRSLDIDVVLDLMIHDLDLIMHLAGSPIADIRAVGIPVLTSQVDIANARLEFENGCVANVTSSRVSSEKIRKLRFFQPHDYVSIDFHRQHVRIYSLVDSGSGKRILEQEPEIQKEQPLKLELRAFLQTVRQGPGQMSSLSCGAGEGKRALDLALTILRLMGRSKDRP